MKTDAKKYNNIKLATGIGEAVISFILLFLFAALGFSKSLESAIRNYFTGDYLVFLVYVIGIGVFSSVIFSPLSYYTGYYLEHKYNLSNQTFFKWVFEGAKGMLVGSVIGLPVITVFFWVIRSFGLSWWVPFGIVLFILSVFLAQIVPVVILPLFYKVTPLDNESLKEKIIGLCSGAGLNVSNIYRFNMSKNTKKANAAFTGLGSTKRILLGDTLLDNFTEDEIETVIAHELGHYKKKHIVKNILISTLSSFLIFFLVSRLHYYSLPFFGFSSITEIASLPLLVLWGSVIGLIQTPVSNIISRRFEYEADQYSVAATNKSAAFLAALEKLTIQNLGDKDPHPFVEWFFYSHPSISNRIRRISSS
jgi:STE24 endopeptidase